MDVITLISEVKETIDLDKMSPDELRKVVKHLWHKVASLSSQVEMNRWRNTHLTGGSVTYLGNSALDAIPT